MSAGICGVGIGCPSRFTSVTEVDITLASVAIPRSSAGVPACTEAICSGFNYNVNDAVELTEAVEVEAKRLGRLNTMRNILRHLLLIPKNDGIGYVAIR